MKLDFMKETIKNDPETKDLILNDQDVLVVYQYLLQRDANDSLSYKPRLKFKPYLQVVYEPTKEKLQKDLTQTIKRNLETFESDIYIADATLDDFIISDELQQKAVDYARSTINHKDKFMPGLYLYGPNGTGKSFLLSGLANELTKHNVDVIYAFVPDLIRSLKGAISTNQLEKRINVLKRTNVLILDDLGGENMSLWFRDEILLPVLHYRLNANLMVHISSNVTLNELIEVMTVDKDNDAIRAARLVKRIHDLTKIFKLSKRFKND
jgi:primosomal protein DnaI